MCSELFLQLCFTQLFCLIVVHSVASHRDACMHLTKQCGHLITGLTHMSLGGITVAGGMATDVHCV